MEPAPHRRLPVRRRALRAHRASAERRLLPLHALPAAHRRRLVRAGAGRRAHVHAARRATSWSSAGGIPTAGSRSASAASAGRTSSAATPTTRPDERTHGRIRHGSRDAPMTWRQFVAYAAAVGADPRRRDRALRRELARLALVRRSRRRQAHRRDREREHGRGRRATSVKIVANQNGAMSGTPSRKWPGRGEAEERVARAAADAPRAGGPARRAGSAGRASAVNSGHETRIATRTTLAADEVVRVLVDRHEVVREVERRSRGSRSRGSSGAVDSGAVQFTASSFHVD